MVAEQLVGGLGIDGPPAHYNGTLHIAVRLAKQVHRLITIDPGKDDDNAGGAIP